MFLQTSIDFTLAGCVGSSDCVMQIFGFRGPDGIAFNVILSLAVPLFAFYLLSLKSVGHVGTASKDVMGLARSWRPSGSWRARSRNGQSPRSADASALISLQGHRGGGATKE